MKKLALIFSLILGSGFSLSSANAITGNNLLEASENPKSACRIESYQDQYQKGFATCTATILTPNIILTAKHCFNKNHNYRLLKCDYNYGPVKDWRRFAESFNFVTDLNHVTNFHDSDNLNSDDEINLFAFEDISIISLKEALKAPTLMKIARKDFKNKAFNYVSSSDGVNIYRLKKGTECRISGFGRNDSDVMNSLVTGVLDNIDHVLFLYEDQKSGMGYLSFLKDTVTTRLPFQDDSELLELESHVTRTQLGDSGGPIYCKDSGEWFQIGVTSAASNKVLKFTSVIGLKI